jgi:hypothetical protein
VGSIALDFSSTKIFAIFTYSKPDLEVDEECSQNTLQIKNDILICDHPGFGHEIIESKNSSKHSEESIFLSMRISHESFRDMMDKLLLFQQKTL